jgi:hypothetical protein
LTPLLSEQASFVNTTGGRFGVSIVHSVKQRGWRRICLCQCWPQHWTEDSGHLHAPATFLRRYRRGWVGPRAAMDNGKLKKQWFALLEIESRPSSK